MSKKDPAGAEETTTRIQGRHAGLSRDQVLQAALDLLDAEGPSALSMRRLARNLGVEAMTLYHHVANKAALEDAVIEHVLTEAFADVTATGPWQEVLFAYAMALHGGLRAHPSAIPLFARRPAMTARNLDQLEHLLEPLTRAGFSAGTALTIVRATAASVIGQHLSFAAGTAADTTDPAVSGTNAVGTDLAEEHALTAQALAPGLPGLDELVECTVTALVTGYAQLL